MRNALTILKEDKRFASLLPYDRLRELGIEYISNLSGNIWTDHNIHDPGITILEILCYALTDLGYRTRLDFEEIVAPSPGTGLEDNFFTPEQILTCNPLTISDLRKMLIDIEGVRNAWLVPASEQEVPLFTGCSPESLGYSRRDLKPLACGEDLVTIEEMNREVVLNGLYKVYLDIDPILGRQADACEEEGARVSAILREVNNRLHRHRNLCEDYLEICVLKDEEIGVCADLELKPDANPDEVLGRIYDVIETFLSPRLPFYSLPEMIAKGRSLEEIFEGRPYTPAYSPAEARHSHGFVDMEELEKQQLPTTLFASDFYRIIMQVEGVRAIKSLSLRNFLAGNPQTLGEDWVLHLSAGHRPLFAPERSAFNFYKGVLRLPTTNKTGVIERFRKRLSDFRKSKYPASRLDLSIPYGQFRADLPDYYSVQNEFPLTYRIGKGQMPDSASVERKVQALQLQGYLAFFDQLLANYLCQLANIRKLFSISQPGTGGRATYFSQSVDSMPEAHRIFRYYRDQNSPPPTNETLAEAVISYTHPAERDFALQQLATLFKNANSGEDASLIGIGESNGSYHFVINGSGGQPMLRSVKQYPAEREARNAAQTVLFLGIFEQSYRKINWPGIGTYTFQIADNPPGYQEFLVSIGESEALYLRRRDQFLSHLLARFGEQFTEYVLLMYALNQKEIDRDKVIEDKSRFLSNYPAISRNRGKGFDYTWKDRIWDSSENISGIEQRVAGLMGLENWERRYLNNFEVVLRDQECVLFIQDHRGTVILETLGSFKNNECSDPPQEPCEELCLEQAKNKLQSLLCDPRAYHPVDCETERIYGLELIDDHGVPFAKFLRSFGTKALRDAYLSCILGFFCEPENIVVVTPKTGEDRYGFRLLNEKGETLLDSIDGYASASEAAKAAAILEDHARHPAKKLYFFDSPNSLKNGFGIKAGNKGQLNAEGGITAVYPEVFDEKDTRDTRKQSIKNYLNALLPLSAGINLKLVSAEEGFYFFLTADDDETVYLKSSKSYPTEREACMAWIDFVPLARVEENYTDLTGNYAGGPHSFGVIKIHPDGTTEEVAFHPAGYTSREKRSLRKKEIFGYIKGKKLGYDILQSPPLYSWAFFEGLAGGLLLEGIHRFKTEADARDAWTWFLAKGLREENYLIEPQAEGGFRILIFQEEDLPIARSPVYEEWEESQAARDQLLNLLAEDAPLYQIRQHAGQFNFVVHSQHGETSLIGQILYPTAEDAECAFYHFANKAAVKANYREVVAAGTCLYSFEVVENDLVLATHPHFYPEGQKNKVQEEFIAHVKANYLHFELADLPDSWHYEIWWQSCEGACEPLLVEIGEHETALAAKEAAQELLNHCEELVPESIQEEEGYTFVVMLGETAKARHPNFYATDILNDKVMADAAAYLDFYCRLMHDKEELIKKRDRWQVCGEMGDEPALFSAFRLTKTKQLLALHTRTYHSREERDQVKKDLLAAAKCGLLQYTELCLLGDRPVRKIDKKFHYELWSHHPESRLLWRSIEGYGSREDAMEAFQTNWMKILQSSQKAGNYQNPSAEFPYVHLLLSGEPTVFIPGSFPDAEAIFQAIQERILFAGSYPVYPKGKAYAFRLVGENGTTVLWESAQTFGTLEEAWAQFRNFKALLKAGPHYRCIDIPEACLFRIGIQEILLEGATTYFDKFIAQTHAISGKTFTSREEALIGLSEARKISSKIPYSKVGSAVVPVKLPDGTSGYQYQLVGKGPLKTILWQSTAVFGSRQEARTAFEEQYLAILHAGSGEMAYQLDKDIPTGRDQIFLVDANNAKQAFIPDATLPPADLIRQRIEFANLFPIRKTAEGRYIYRLEDPENPGENYWQSPVSYRTYAQAERAFQEFRRYLGVEKAYCAVPGETPGEYRLVVQKLWLAGDLEEPLAPDTQYEICPVTGSPPYVEIEGMEVKVSEICDPKNEDPKLRYISPAAWNKGLQNFLIYAIDEELFYPYQDVQDCCCHSFRVVTDKYRVARNPRESQTPAEREQLRNWLYQYSLCHKDPILELPSAKVMAREGKCYYYLEDEGKKMWRSYQGYETKPQAEKAFAGEVISLFGYARELDFYQLIRHNAGGNPCYQIGLTDRNNVLIAVSPQFFTQPAEWNAAILERILFARRFPFYQYKGKFGFQCFSMENLPDFTVPADTSDCYPEIEPEPENDCPPAIGQIDVDVKGEVIWESIYEYDTLEEAMCVFEVFYEKLLGDLDNYQRIQFEDCNLFGIEVTHPGEVLATHPRCYPTRKEVMSAIERTRRCINAEGFHLVEHLLLRPKEGISDDYTLQFYNLEPVSPCDDPLMTKVPYLLVNRQYADQDSAFAAMAEFKTVVLDKLVTFAGQTTGPAYPVLRTFLIQTGMPPASIDPFLSIVTGLPMPPAADDLSVEMPPVENMQANLEELGFLFNPADDIDPDLIMPNCPDCCHAEALPAGEASADACQDPKALLKSRIASCSGEKPEAEAKAPVEWYIPGADPYSFWTTVVLPYWPERFQNINFRRFFEDTLRREFPAHIAIRICWLDPRQMIQFERFYRDWLEALSGQENCNLKQAQACLIKFLFDMKTVYPPARLQRDGCTSGSGEPNAVLLDYTQLG
ncbi:MAG: hypothetical protein WA004_11785 [Saprospiraceae bacterium]